MGTGGLKPSAESINELDRLIGTRGLAPRLPLHLLISKSGGNRLFDLNADPGRDGNTGKAHEGCQMIESQHSRGDAGVNSNFKLHPRAHAGLGATCWLRARVE